MKLYSFQINETMLGHLQKIAEDEAVPVSSLIREAISDMLRKRECLNRKFLKEFEKATGRDSLHFNFLLSELRLFGFTEARIAALTASEMRAIIRFFALERL